MLAAASLALLAARLYASSRIGFGDSEALYASYALHPQPAYLDHPGLIGVVARAVGDGTAPSPERAHVVTSLLATLVPWAMAAACRACGATWRRSFAAAVIVALVPEMAIGLFAMTPDLLLVLSWTGALALAAMGLRAPVGGGRAAFAFAGTGLLAGIAAASKVSGVLLLAALAVAYASRSARAHARTLAPWAGIAAGLVVIAPVVAFEARMGWPLLRHRLIETQTGAGFSLRNAGALAGGQLVYLSPPMVVMTAYAASAAWRGKSDAVGALLLSSCAVPATALVPLCLWSPVAEPHWVAPALLALAPAMARADAGPPRRLVVASGAIAGAMVAAVHAWVLVPQAVRLAPASYDARIDLANELYGWPDAVRAVRQEAELAHMDAVVVGPHWVVCGQLEAALRNNPPVGCDTPVHDDFDGWLPRERWRAADTIVWVTDGRFGPPPDLPTHTTLRTRQVAIRRGGRVVRTFTISVLTRRAMG